MARGYISLKTKLASALLTIVRPNAEGKLEPVIPHEEAKGLSADEVISRFDFHHYPIPHAHGGPDEHWNLEPMPRSLHREITAKIDIPRIAKTKRLSKSQEEFRRKVMEKPCGAKREKTGNWPQGRKLRSKGFGSRQ